MNLILSADKNWAIGKDNQLLVRIPADMKFFRETTTGKVIIAGRKTLESFQDGLPLKNRINIILTRNLDYKAEGAVLVHNKAELEEELKKYNSNDVYVVGGGSIYQMLIKECDTAYVTKVNSAYQADTYFPNLDLDPEWELVSGREKQAYLDLEYYFLKYQRVKQDRQRRQNS